jgi:hypothetical protein
VVDFSPSPGDASLTIRSRRHYQFWNVKLLSRFTSSSASSSAAPSRRTSTASSLSGSGAASPQRVAAELEETAESLKRRQQEMERHVQRVWTVLSAFEESSAACISDMLSHVSNSLYMEAVHMAEKFIFHVEVLFATIDELEAHFAAADAKGASVFLSLFCDTMRPLILVHSSRHVARPGSQAPLSHHRQLLLPPRSHPRNGRPPNDRHHG